MKVILFVALALVAFAMAEEEVREKKDVLLGTHHYGHWGYDDGKYWPGKYEKSILPTTYSGVHHYGAYPYNYNWGSYPYHIAGRMIY